MLDPLLSTVLVVDDAPANLSLLAGLLNKHHRVKLASSGAKALELVERAPPDLILLDVMMPEMDGYEVCRRLKAHPRSRHIPVLFLTAMTQPEDEARGFEVGCADFIHKPISPSIVQARVRTHLQIKSLQDELLDRNAWLEVELGKRLAQVDHLRDATLHLMVSFAEFRDEETGFHVKRTQEYVRTLAQHLYDQGQCLDVLSPASINSIARSAPLHDIGKVAIPDHILLKPGKLTPEEMVVMKGHSLHGWEMLQRAAHSLDKEGDYLHDAMLIARHHHEKWDGGGYPDGLAGEQIPLQARLMAVADVYDALTSRRPYKVAFTHDEATALITKGSGAHFDPQVVAAFHATIDDFLTIASAWQDA